MCRNPCGPKRRGLRQTGRIVGWRSVPITLDRQIAMQPQAPARARNSLHRMMESCIGSAPPQHSPRPRSNEQQRSSDGTGEQTDAVTEGKDDRVLVELAPPGQEPQSRDPVEQQGADQPQSPGVRIKVFYRIAADVKRQNEHRHVATGRADVLQQAAVGDAVTASLGRCLPFTGQTRQLRMRLTKANDVKRNIAKAMSHSETGV